MPEQLIEQQISLRWRAALKRQGLQQSLIATASNKEGVHA